jgi:PBSX family phage terminase large subunit
MTGLVHSWKPRGNAAKIFVAERNGNGGVARAAAVVLAGPAGTGKSRACLEKLHMVCMMRGGTKALIVRRTFASIRFSALVTFQEHVAREHIAAGVVNIYGGTVPQQIQYLNGSTIDIVGMDKPTRIMSTEYDIIYVQEAIELELDHWNALDSRARGTALSYCQLLADCNPSHDQHWLLQLAEDGKIVMLDTQHEDNPRYFNEDGTVTEEGAAYMARLDGLTGVWLQRLRYGKWVGAQGIIYDNFDKRVHVVETMPKGWESWPTFWAIDFGFVHPFVCTMWAVSPDGILYMFKEYYKSHTLVEDIARELKVEVDAGRIKRPTKILTDHDAEDRATFEKHFGRGTSPANKTVSRGIQATHARFKVGANGKAGIYLLKNALMHRPDAKLLAAKKPTSTVGEIGGYIWDPNGKDQPLKKDDDGCDTMRYAVAERDLSGDYNLRWL